MKLASIIAVLAFAFVANAQEGQATPPAATDKPAATEPAAATAPAKKEAHAKKAKKKHKKGETH